MLPICPAFLIMSNLVQQVRHLVIHQPIRYPTEKESDQSIALSDLTRQVLRQFNEWMNKVY